MPYVPAKDRPAINAAVEEVADKISDIIKDTDITLMYLRTFIEMCVGVAAERYYTGLGGILAKAVNEAGDQYGYDGAYLGEMNYCITRLIQRVPQIMVQKKKWKDELRYWLYACTVGALIQAADECLNYLTSKLYAEAKSEDAQRSISLAGVFEDVKDEYKRRVNPSYEAAQIVKSGDCYDTPYYNRLITIVTKSGKEIGKFLVDMPRSEDTLHTDILPVSITVDDV